MPLGAVELADYWKIIDEINRMAQADFVSLWRMLEAQDKEALFRGLQAGVPEIVGLYRNAQADAAMVFYNTTQGVGYSRAAATAAGKVNEEQLERMLRYAVFGKGVSSPVGLISGAIQQMVLGGGRDYANHAFAQSGVGWYRAARADACAFCRMLATRGATEWEPYTSANSAFSKKGPSGYQYHKHCRCIPVLASEYSVPDYVNEWAETYYKASASLSTTTDFRAILAEMREIDGIKH
ncbi:VG15 protein [Corynebacterium riegelii]|uniref:VG15 protein n=1 Tax=Corynebacterium riegelii TaxID=156976 RepID=UPI00288BEF90|nr:hypothetical protein [Corynebacterium riegelii]